MLKIDHPAAIENELQTAVDGIDVPERPDAWTKNTLKNVKLFKKKILEHGLNAQRSCCVWCTLSISEKGHRTAHRDHIAPKKAYPQWTFLSKNIAISCEYCNGFFIKKDLDTVDIVNNIYDDTIFKIVHPYLDTPSEHIEFVDENNNVIIKGISEKGKWTVEKMRLDSSGLTLERSKDLIFYKGIETLPEHFAQLLKQATSRP